jgi:hypothetical protein
MRRRSLTILVLVLGCALTESAHGALITAAGGRRKAKTSGTYKITTTTQGQRQIAIAIDPSVTTAFRLDVIFPDGLVTPVSLSDTNSELTDDGIDYFEPYVASGPRASILPGLTDVGGIISNVEGRLAAQTVEGAAPELPAPNRPDGGSDLFTLYFIDHAPEETKHFMIVGVSDRGVDPSFDRYIGDNYLEALIDDPDDPLHGQLYRFAGDEIEAGIITIPGLETHGGPGGVPLPPAVLSGVAGAAAVLVRRAHRPRLR